MPPTSAREATAIHLATQGVSRNSMGRLRVQGGGGGRALPGPLSSACSRSRRRKSRGGIEIPHTNATQFVQGRTCPPPPPVNPPKPFYPRRGSRGIRGAGSAYGGGVGGVPS